MGAIFGMIAGCSIAMFLTGHVAAWAIRKFSKASKFQSFAVGVMAMTFVGAWSITYEGGPTFWENWVWYAFGAAIALLLMLAGQKPKRTAETSMAKKSA